MNDLFKKVKKIHFIGIGGSGMSGIAEVLLNLGYKISGSDLKKSEITSRLKKLGAKIYFVHKETNVKEVDVVVTSTAIKPNNPEVLSAKKRNIPTIPRIEMLAEIARLKYTLSVCGTHGKTTTTSMLGLLLDTCGYDPTIVVGGKFNNIGTGAKIGNGKYIVVESDESDGSFLKLSPYIVVCTNIDNDHLDYYGTFDNLKKSFLQHYNSVPFYGFNILCGDDKNILSLIPNVHRKYFTYGLNQYNDFIAKDIEQNDEFMTYKIYFKNKYAGKIFLKVFGIHNVLNSLSVTSLGLECGFEFKKIKIALENFDGVARRLEYKGKIIVNGKSIEVYDDYGHHPTEMYNTINTLRNKTKKDVVIIFQPHRYSRTKILYREFASAFSKKDKIFLTEIYPATEKPIKGISSKLIYDDMLYKGLNVSWYKMDNVIKSLNENTVLLTLGAGNIVNICDSFIKKYGK